jgi:hypothetical protein
VDTIRRLYCGLKAKITIGKEKAEIPQTLGVRQGNNLSPVLFLFIMSALGKSFDDEYWNSITLRVNCRRVSLENVYSGKLIEHNLPLLRLGRSSVYLKFDI